MTQVTNWEDMPMLEPAMIGGKMDQVLPSSKYNYCFFEIALNLELAIYYLCDLGIVEEQGKVRNICWFRIIRKKKKTQNV